MATSNNGEQELPRKVSVVLGSYNIPSWQPWKLERSVSPQQRLLCPELQG